MMKTKLEEIKEFGSIKCGNCEAWRSLDGWDVEECQNCGDDEFNLIEQSLALEELGYTE